VLIGAALWLESSLLFSWAATGLLAFSKLYTVDLLGRWIGRVHLLGGTEFMFDAGLPWAYDC
jgi:hypothetical protein